MMEWKALLKAVVEMEGSDLFLRAGAAPRVRINGVLKDLSATPLSPAEMTAITDRLLADEERRRIFQEQRDVDFACHEPDVGRFRVSLFHQRGAPALVARYVRSVVGDFVELNLPADLLKTFCEESSGLVILSGPAGSGKSTTIASMIEYINGRCEKHIVTLEDPIEYLFESRKSLINQRELGFDVPSYPAALRHVTQQSPDIIYIGTIRDAETMRAAITATELGTFVITTFHTVNAVQTITRIVNFFPPYLHDEVRLQLSVILKGVVSLRLLPRVDRFGRIPACETMVVTPTIARLIREGKINEIQPFIDEGRLFGMQSFKQTLVRLVREGIVDEEVARRAADSKDDFNLALKGITRYDG